MSILSRHPVDAAPRQGFAGLRLSTVTVSWRIAAPVAGEVTITVAPDGRAEARLLPDAPAPLPPAPLALMTLTPLRDGPLLHLDGDGTSLTIDADAAGGPRLLYARTSVLEALTVPGGCALAPALSVA